MDDPGFCLTKNAANGILKNRAVLSAARKNKKLIGGNVMDGGSTSGTAGRSFDAEPPLRRFLFSIC